jgi:hypothetical protein
LLAEREKNNRIKIHGGTLFDYYFVFRREMTAQERTRLVLLEYLKGLRNLAQATTANVTIQGTSYFLNERTANKLGLRKVTTDRMQQLIMLFNYVNIMLSLSLVKRSIVFPSLNRLSTFEGKAIDLQKSILFLNELIAKLEGNDHQQDVSRS